MRTKTAATISRTSYCLKIHCGVLISDTGERDKSGKWKAVGKMWLVSISKTHFSFLWSGMEEDGMNPLVTIGRKDPTFLQLSGYNEYLGKRWDGQGWKENLGNNLK